MKLAGRVAGAVLLSLQVLTVLGSGYELRVMVHAYRNPTGTCHDCFNGTPAQPACCDSNSQTENCDTIMDGGCDNLFRFCQRALGTIANVTTCPNPGGQPKVTSSMMNSDNVTFAGDVFGLPNPVIFTGMAWQGVQLFVEVFDMDTNSPIDVVDVFAVSVDISPGPGFTDVVAYNGFYGIGEIDLSFQVMCMGNFDGSNCTDCVPGFTGADCLENIDDCVNNNCVENAMCIDIVNSFLCNCLPGFMLDGGACVNIDDCVGVDCGTNQQCVDAINNHSCECVPGFTGDDCLTIVDDDCIGIDCGNGDCRDGMNTFTCDCNPGFTGENCFTDINECEENSCSGNTQCVDGIATFTCVCNPGFTGENCTPEESPETEATTSTASQDLGTIIGAVVGGSVGLILLVVVVLLLVALLVRRRRQRSVKFKPAQGNSYEDTLPRSENTLSNREQQHSATAIINHSNSEEGDRELKNPIYGMSFDNSYAEVGGAVTGSHAEQPAPAGSEYERELKNPIYGMGDEDNDGMVDNSTYGLPAKKPEPEAEYDVIEEGGMTYSRVEDGKTLDYKVM